MRRYIRTADLACTLRDLINARDPELRQIYKEVMLYRATHNAKRYPRAARMLFTPVKIQLIIFNVLLCLGAFFMLPTPSISFTPQNYMMLKAAVFSLIIMLNGFWLIRTLPDARACVPYLHIDEMMKRKILILKKTAAAPKAEK